MRSLYSFKLNYRRPQIRVKLVIGLENLDFQVGLALNSLYMELIIKPTEACNFKCTFCSSTQISSAKNKVLAKSKILQFLEKYPYTSTIIVNGGDPLMVTPQYYFEILDYIRQKKLKTQLSLTTNLWAFFKNSNLWTELFLQPEVSVCTSFNYGNTRRITENIIYTEEMFWNVSNLFLEKVGYRPDFISVINDDNCQTAIDNVRLAQKMDVVCKLNYAMASGEQKRPFLLSSIYKIYLEIYNLGLADWEFNTQQMIKRIRKQETVCPQNRTCGENIRCLQPDEDYYSCGSFADDKDFAIDFEAEMKSIAPISPFNADAEIKFLKTECLSCPMFDICNGCHKTIKDLKNSNLVDAHCVQMKSISSKIIQLQGAHDLTC